MVPGVVGQGVGGAGKIKVGPGCNKRGISKL